MLLICSSDPRSAFGLRRPPFCHTCPLVTWWCWCGGGSKQQNGHSVPVELCCQRPNGRIEDLTLPHKQSMYWMRYSWRHMNTHPRVSFNLEAWFSAGNHLSGFAGCHHRLPSLGGGRDASAWPRVYDGTSYLIVGRSYHIVLSDNLKGISWMNCNHDVLFRISRWDTVIFA